MKHTQGPWTAISGVEPDDIHRCGVTARRGNLDYLVATIENGAPNDTCATEFANAERIVACVNAMTGIEDPQSFVDSHAAMLENLKLALVLIDQGDLASLDGWDALQISATAAIAKATP